MSFPTSITPIQGRNRGGRPAKTQPQTLQPAGTGRGDDEGDAGPSRRGPVLELGKQGEARLEQDEAGKWGWTWLKRDDRGSNAELRHPREIYRGQRTPPNELAQKEGGLQEDQSSLRRRASAEYLRNLPDAPDYGELNQLVNVEMDFLESYERSGAYDPFVGRRVAVLESEASMLPDEEGAGDGRGPKGRIPKAVLFPTGQVGQQLGTGIAGLLPSSDKDSIKWSCWPQTDPLHVFQTSILQVETVALPTAFKLGQPAHDEDVSDLRQHLVLIRLHSSLQLFILSMMADWESDATDPSAPASLELVKMLGPGDMRGKRVVDCALDTSMTTSNSSDRDGTRSRVVLVDEGGDVWLWEPSGDQKLLLIYSAKPVPVLHSTDGIEAAQSRSKSDGFYRIDFGSQPDTALLLTAREAIHLSLAFPSFKAHVAVRLDPESHFTALGERDTGCGERLRCLATNKELIWLNEAEPDRAVVLSWKHELGAAARRDLELCLLPVPGEIENQSLTILSSRTDPAVLAYEIATDPLSSTAAPQPLAVPLHAGQKPLCSFVALRLPHSRQPTNIDGMSSNADDVGSHQSASVCLIGLSPSGSLWSVDCVLAPRSVPESEQEARVNLRVEWDEIVRDIVTTHEDGDADGNWRNTWGSEGREKAERRYWVIDARWVWPKINRLADLHGSFEGGNEDDEREDPSPLGKALEGFERIMTGDHEVFEHEQAETPRGFRTAAEILRELLQEEDTAAPDAGRPRSKQVRAWHPSLATPNEGKLADSISFVQNSLDAPLTQSIYRVNPLLHSPPASPPHLTWQTTLDRLRSLCPARIDLPDKVQAYRAKSSNILALDLWLSSIIRAPASSRQSENEVSGHPSVASPEDLVARMTIAELGPPAIRFSHFRPTRDLQVRSSDEDQGRTQLAPKMTSGEEKPGDPLQTRSARTLMAEWTVGDDPTDYLWTPYHSGGDEQGLALPRPGDSRRPDYNQTQGERPMRPLPGSSSVPARLRLAQTQPISSSRPLSGKHAPSLLPQLGQTPTNISQIVPQLQLQHLRLNDRQSPHQGGARGNGGQRGSMSPPPVNSSQQEAERMRVQTQVERGPFGGRPEGREKKKKPKKRAGGF